MYTLLFNNGFIFIRKVFKKITFLIGLYTSTSSMKKHLSHNSLRNDSKKKREINMFYSDFYFIIGDTSSKFQAVSLASRAAMGTTFIP